MRILRLLITALVLFIILTVGTFFVSREILLFLGSSTLKSSVKTLNESRSKNAFASQCAELGGTQGSSTVQYQLRFLSSSEYLLEAACDGFAYEPITIAQEKLPQFVTKVPGTSGFIVSHSSQSGIEIEVFKLEIDKLAQALGVDLTFLQKQKPLVVENGLLVSDSVQDQFGTGPVTVCEGYGYQCCDAAAQLGVGDRIAGLTDCEDQCFAQCASRPLVLSFNTNPILDPRNRTVMIKSGTPVEFTFVADSGNAQIATGILDFGDGTKAQISGLAGQTSHTYECARTSCEYIAKVTLEDNWGVKSADLGINSVKVIVTR